MVLTDEEISKIFALHLGCKGILGVTYNSNQLEHINSELVGIYIDGKISVQCYSRSGEPWNTQTISSIEHFTMALIPINKIKDEHALEFAIIEMHKSVHTSDVGRGRLLLELQEAVMSDGYTYGPISYKTFQWLISKGYDVPLWLGTNHWANGKTVIELGLAIEKH